MEQCVGDYVKKIGEAIIYMRSGAINRFDDLEGNCVGFLTSDNLILLLRCQLLWIARVVIQIDEFSSGIF